METATQPTTLKYGEICPRHGELECSSPYDPAPEETPVQHSPLPWAVLRDDEISDLVRVVQVDGYGNTLRLIAKMPRDSDWPQSSANAELIVKCVNRDPAFQKLVEAAELLISEIGGYQNVIQLEGFTKLREALRLAREGEG